MHMESPQNQPGFARRKHGLTRSPAIMLARSHDRHKVFGRTTLRLQEREEHVVRWNW